MGRTSNSGLVYGSTPFSQQRLEQFSYSLIAGENERALYRSTMVDDGLLDELRRRGIKFTDENVEFVTRDRTGQIVWLESGNRMAGLEHILHGHAKDFFNAFGVSKAGVAQYLQTIITHGDVVSNKLKRVGSSGRMGYERVYYYDGSYCVVTGIGTNGFIVSAYPRRHK